jgi:hypothetical protein
VPHLQMAALSAALAVYLKSSRAQGTARLSSPGSDPVKTSPSIPASSTRRSGKRLSATLRSRPAPPRKNAVAALAEPPRNSSTSSPLTDGYQVCRRSPPPCRRSKGSLAVSQGKPLLASDSGADANSLYYLVCTGEQRGRRGETERLCSLQINDQLHIRGLVDGQIGRLGAVDNVARIDSNLP